MNSDYDVCCVSYKENRDACNKCVKVVCEFVSEPLSINFAKKLLNINTSDGVITTELIFLYGK